ncbi:hypothetical protein, partial [Streptomyces sp. NPDC056304]|uniref:hypothetical protein n=1 Tax=Streptomyces sp. NPDC056304 TaxID=3345778 RepID=UPI0035DE74CA
MGGFDEQSPSDAVGARAAVRAVPDRARPLLNPAADARRARHRGRTPAVPSTPQARFAPRSEP